MPNVSDILSDLLKNITKKVEDITSTPLIEKGDYRATLLTGKAFNNKTVQAVSIEYKTKDRLGAEKWEEVGLLTRDNHPGCDALFHLLLAAGGQEPVPVPSEQVDETEEKSAEEPCCARN